MTKDQPMTDFVRQRRRVKHAVVSGVKQYGKRKNPTPSAPESESVAAPPPAPANPETEIATEGEDRSGASKEDDDGGPIDKSVLISFKDHITYAIWNREEEVMAKKAKSLLDRAIEGAEGGNISIVVARSVRDKLSSAIVERWQEERRKKRHEASTAPSASTSPPTTAQRALSASLRPPRPPVANTRTQATKGKAPAKKKSKN
ncbi:hypothetical protein LguiA_033708 [Lonicera macranthoides]